MSGCTEASTFGNAPCAAFSGSRRTQKPHLLPKPFALGTPNCDTILLCAIEQLALEERGSSNPRSASLFRRRTSNSPFADNIGIFGPVAPQVNAVK